MPRVITAAEAAKLGAQPIEPRVLSAAEAEALGAVPVESDVEARILELGGVKQPDGTYLVPNEQGGPALRLDAQGNQLDAPAIGEESTAEAIGNRVLATAASGSQSLLPQIAGAAKVAATLPENPGEVYRQQRDETRRDVETAREKAGIGYDVAGAVLSGGLAAPESLGARALLNAGIAGVNAAAQSDVDLTKSPDLGAFARDVAIGAGAGAALSGAGEALGAGLRKAGGAISNRAAKAIAAQTAKDAAAVEKEVASLAGKLGAETQKGSRIIENLQRGTEGIPDIPGARELAEGVLANNRAALPGQLGVIDAAKTALTEAAVNAPAEAARRTRDYFAAPLFQSEILPRLKSTIAPRFGLAAAGMVLGGAADLLTGGDGRTGGFTGAVLGAPGMMQMLRNVAKSPRVQVAVASKLAPLLEGVANGMARGMLPTAAVLSQFVLREESLGPPELTAQQIVASSGLASVVGTHKPIPGAEFNAPQTEVDKAIQQTAAITLLGGALEEQNERLSKGLDRVFKGKPEKVKSTELPDMGALTANPQLMLERVSANAGNLATVAPGIAAELAATAQRAADYLLKVGATPPKAGPLAPDWERSAAEKRALRLAEGVIAQPMSILEAAASGMLVPEQVAALNAVYPMLGRQMADMALDKLTSGEAVSYRARLMVGFLTGVDPDGTFASIGPNQIAIRQQSQKPSNAGVGQLGASKLTLAERTSESAES